MGKRISIAAAGVFLCVASAWLSAPSRTLAARFAGDPNQAAWSLFVNINRPAQDGKSSLWENWALRSDVFTEYPTLPAWPAAHPLFKTFERLRQEEELMVLLQLKPERGGRQIFDVTASSEVRLNCSTFQTIVGNDLWHRKGLLDRAAAVAAGTAQPIQLQSSSIAVKAKWRPATGEDNLSHFHTGIDAKGTKWVLVGLHVTNRSQSNWFWATWEQKDNPQRQASSDTFGFPNGTTTPSAGLAQMLTQNQLGSEWSYYRLDGAQTDFLSPKLLGNSEIERGFMDSSSCITCHFRAGIFASGRSISPFDASGHGFVGNPLPMWFAVQGDSFMQTDFLWSVTDSNYFYEARHVNPVCVDTPPANGSAQKRPGRK